jgi:hypothetical protein
MSITRVTDKQVTYKQGATGSVVQNLGDKLRESVSVLDFFANGVSGVAVDPTGVVDSTLGIQAAIAKAVELKQPLDFPAGTYLVTETINILIGTQLKGVKGDQYPNGFGVNPLATTINFQPTVADSDLFVASGTTLGGFRFHYSIEGFYFTSNSNARYALNLDSVIYGRFENIAMANTFQYGVRCLGTINNRFCNVYATGTTAAVLYSGSATTDVWNQCSFWGSPQGVIGDGANINIRFVSCLFEQLDLVGANIAQENQNWSFVDCYSEDVPYANNAANSMFRVGLNGSTPTTATILKVIGGDYQGRTAGAIGSFLDTYNTVGIQLTGVYAARYTALIQTAASVSGRAIQCAGVQFNSIATPWNDATKLDGFLNYTDVNSAGGSVAYLQSLTSNQLYVPTVNESAITVTASNGLTTHTVSAGANYLTGTTGASLAITMPAAASAINGQKIVVMATATRVSTTWASAGATVVGAPSTLTADTPVCLHYHLATLSWYISL